ncbi:hypothetical protein C7Y71_000180 [Pseudoprevotella muciniphila]|uniref:Prophage tail endopeptidase domain-containing protein n=1 Tax=Pseudoprevotella muciniphila TaxID=2133944 RepID=A0A5P8E3H3_9BACT|nr:hypothetical protein [Pseudoprevotella muciniphila]QFQ11575.1 hypothetical protein C7Y71_000180 [Pseudoprevotella muciniphila]
MIEIYGSNGQLKCQVEPVGSSQQDKSLQGDNVLSLSFTHYAFLELEVNDYADFAGDRYWLQERYLPSQKNEREWEYNVKLYGIESLIKRLLVLQNSDGENEAVFTLTAPATEHVRLIVENINDGMDHTTNWKVGTVIESENLTIDYDGTYCNEGLRLVAEAAGAEWWIEGETVNLCRCEHGEELTLRYGESLLSLDRDEADGVKFYTRLFPIGSSRNIDREKYGSTRLQLPDGAKYVDIPGFVEKYGVFHHYEQEAFSGIYPRRLGEISNVRWEEVKDSDGNPFTIWYFRDDGLTFDPNDYEIAGLVKHVSFQSGELEGRDFEVNYNSETREFEIITTWPYDDDTQLPDTQGGLLVPKATDTYILWNIRMPDEYYGLAEQEYLAAVEAFNSEHLLDKSVYKAPTNPKWVERVGAQLYVGRRVRLESQKYFPGIGYRSSRITRLTRKASDPCQIDLEISDALSTGAMTKIEDSIHDVKMYAGSILGAVNVPDLIRSWDETKPTDNNIYSARRTHKEFLSKNNADRAKEKIIFDKGIDIGDFEAGEKGARIDGLGNAELLTLVVRQLLRSARFVDGFGGEGWQLWIDEQELANLTIDKLTVRQVMTVLELLVEKIRSVGGQIVVSAANGKIKTVEETDDFYIITFEQENTFQVHDLMRCQTFTGGNLKSYWVEVAAVDGNSVLVEASEFDASLPAEADEVVLMGNTEDTLRQNLILISATEDGQPRIDVMDGVKAKNFTGCLRARLGNLDGINDDWFPADNQPQGNGLYSDNAYLRGTFLLATGEDIKTKFEITEGKIESSMSALRQDFAQEKGYLNNPSFDDGLSKWLTENDTVFWLAGNKWIWSNENVLTKKGDGASVTKDDGRVVVRIKNKYIIQKNASLRSKPTMETNPATGLKEAKPVYLSFLYRCASAGTLKVRFEGVDKTGFENFNSMDVEETLAVTDGYKQYTCNGLWNGTGDFKLSFTGDIYLYMLILSTDKIESLTYKYRTLFEQSEKLVKIAAQNFDQDGNVLAESGIMVKATGTGIYAQGPDGKLALIGVGVQETYIDGEGHEQTRTVIKLTADNIQLEGLVTANQYFKIKQDGSIEAINGKFGGQIDAQSGYIGGFVIANDHIGVGSVTYEEDEHGNLQPVIHDDTNGLFLYDSMIGFNDTDRQAIFGTWNSMGQPMLCRLVDTGNGFLPKWGILFDIRNSSSANLAFAGTGNGVLNGFIDGYKFTKVGVSQANKIYDVGLSDSNRIIVNCSAANAGIALPRLSSVRNALSIVTSTPFAVRLIVTSDLGSLNFYVYGRNTLPDGSNNTPWNSEDYPLITHWNGGCWANIEIGQGGTVEVLLVYDPGRTATIDGFTTMFTARIINMQD